MEDLIFELIKVADIGIVKHALTLAGAWFLLHREIKKPISAVEHTFSTKFEGLQGEIKELSDTLKKVEMNHSWRIKFVESKVEEIEKKINPMN